jgi:hypothetical protein
MTKLISLTFNPNWVEVEEELQRTGQVLDGDTIPDNVLATVFNLKLRELLLNLVKHSVMHCPLSSENEVIHLYD